MTLSLSEVLLPIRLRLQMPMSDEELMRFCTANETLRVERDSNGELIVMSPAGAESSGRNLEISADLAIWTRQNGRGKAFDSSGGFTLPDGSMRSPDAAWIELSRWNALSREDRRRFAPICPDFELRSPSDSLHELRRKMEEWLTNGARMGWLIDPSRKVVEIYRPDREAELVAGASAVEGEGPVAGFLLELGRVWD